jgi:anti-anti-sigma factor
MKRTKKGDLNLPRCLTVEKAEALYKDLRVATEDGKDLILYGDKVEVVDAAGLQLLAATRACVRAANMRFVIRQPSDALLQAVRVTGLQDLLDLPGGEGGP